MNDRGNKTVDIFSATIHIQVNINNCNRNIHINVYENDTINDIRNKIINQINFKNIRLYPIKNRKILLFTCKIIIFIYFILINND